MHRELLLQDLLGPIVIELGVTTNRSMLSAGERTLSPLEWKAFVHTLLHLCVYNLSPTRYFNMTFLTLAFLRRLSGSSSNRTPTAVTRLSKYNNISKEVMENC